MNLTDVLGNPISFTMLMGIAGISIASYLGRLTLLSLISFGISLVVLILLIVFSVLNLKRLKYEIVDFMAVISGLTLFITRLRLIYPSFLYFIPSLVLSFFYFLVLYKVFVSIRQVTFKYHLLGVAGTLLSIDLRSYVIPLSLLFIGLGVSMYFIVTALLLKRILTEKGVINIIDGATWIQMGLSALISFAISPFSELLSIVFWYLALSLFPLVIIASVMKLLYVSVSIKYHPSLWSVIFPQAVFATGTFNVLRLHLIVLPLLYDISLSVLFSALSLFLLFTILLVTK
ncbi:SLAC1 family transporter [Saccharolobus shibatae]|uniref:C4-dicarboxylate transporter/malic acid transport protein n=1 Tax=Saccharolobus shibatae TaxID=2286 RepID=A0A8F5BT73_9CREN|nr:hypothetical protein J5U21_00676 [Saccharolobus shibatae]